MMVKRENKSFEQKLIFNSEQKEALGHEMITKHEIMFAHESSS